MARRRRLCRPRRVRAGARVAGLVEVARQHRRQFDPGPFQPLQAVAHHPVQPLPVGAHQRSIGRLLHQGVPKGVFHLRQGGRQPNQVRVLKGVELLMETHRARGPALL
jgi:hypothetical protein